MATFLFAAIRSNTSSSSSYYVRAFSTVVTTATDRPSSSSTFLRAATTSSTTSTTTPIPMTLLSGFLGSGKTTALKHVLENKKGFKVGVVVNDFARINIDAKLVKNPNEFATNDGTVELANGCACCSLSDELLTSVDELCRGRDFDAVVVELSGVADPVSVKNNWEEAKLLGHPATSLASLDRVVTVVDSSTFGTDWMTWETAGDKDGWTEDGSGEDCSAGRKVPELLAEQVEAADVLLVNKADLAGKERIEAASAVARGLNDKAAIHEVSFGRIDPDKIVGRVSDDDDDDDNKQHKVTATASASSSSSSSDHAHSHDHSHAHSHDDLGIVNFVYQNDRPFDSVRLLSLLRTWPVPVLDDLAELGDLDVSSLVPEAAAANPFAGVLRSKGFAWLAPASWKKDAWRHDTAMYWSHAGKHFGITAAGKWWGSVPRDRMESLFADAPEEYERILKEDWASEEFGDRRQELVFIGIGMDETSMRRELDACLLTDAEFDEYRRELARTM